MEVVPTCGGAQRNASFIAKYNCFLKIALRLGWRLNLYFELFKDFSYIFGIHFFEIIVFITPFDQKIIININDKRRQNELVI
jgi:hypothetical protein